MTVFNSKFCDLLKYVLIFFVWKKIQRFHCNMLLDIFFKTRIDYRASLAEANLEQLALMVFKKGIRQINGRDL